MTMALAESMPNWVDRSKSVLLGLWETQVLTGVENTGCREIGILISNWMCYT